jgi:uncharacterized protein (TIGR02147 family)
MSPYGQKDYKSYLRKRMGEPSRRNGMKSELAAKMHCQTTYLSRVLHGAADLSLEQAEAANDFLHHSKDEAHYFLLLVQKDRAGTQKLRQYFQNQLDEVMVRRLSLKERISGDPVLNYADQAEYYSSWQYAALHIAISIPALRSREQLSRYFRIPMQRVVMVLEFLIRVGLAKEEKGEYIPCETLLMLGSDSPNIIRHHANWRNRAIHSLDNANATRDDLHYSAVVSVARSDLPKIKENLMQVIEKNLVLFKKSKEEEMICCCIDLFGLES